jgi:hypothetical protein
MNVVKEVRELKNQLAYARNIGFFFGAGTSCALKIPNIETLTATIAEKLTNADKKCFDIIFQDLSSVIKDRNVNVEDVLNQIRRVREITGDQETKNYLEVTGADAKNLDRKVCELIYSTIDESEAKADIRATKKFFSWFTLLNREFAKEVFTSNYDLIIEKSLEACRIPYFDGFAGAYEPFFLQESVDKFVGRNELTTNWIRLWKVHGSLNWFWKSDENNGTQRIIRVGKFDKSCIPDNELVIYPSKDKYDSSRKQPFIAYFDRLKNFLLDGELLFVIAGYSFSDQHINEIIFNCLRQNSRLYCISFCYQDVEVERLDNLLGSSHMNMSAFGPKKSIVNGNMEDWSFDTATLRPNEQYENYWDEPAGTFKLGDFLNLVEFLATCSGKSEMIESLVK